MAEEPKTEAGRRDERRDALLARREQRRRRTRRQRLIVAGGLLAAILAVVAVLVASGNGEEEPKRATEPALPEKVAPSHSKSKLARNSSPRTDWRPHRGPVPILEYHVLGKAPADASYPELYVSRPDFRRQMGWLARNGFEAVTLEQVQRAWYRDGTLPPKPVVLSFDDGYRPQFTFALPLLRRHGWAGVLNLKAEGSDLYRSNVEAMLDAGWELASHTIHHLDLTTLDSGTLKEEVAGSRAILRHEYGVPVRNFCYPAGRYDATVVAAVRAAGYRGAMTEIPGYAERDPRFELARFEILGSSGVEGVAAALQSG